MKTSSCALAAVLLWSGIGAALASADTLELYDGRHLHGEVTKTAGGYHIKMKYAEMDVETSGVKQWVKDEPVHKAPPAGEAPNEAKPVNSTSDNPGGKPDTAQSASTANISALLGQGRDAMEAEDYAAARDAFSDALELDGNNAEAQLGLGLAYLRLKDYKRARGPMEKVCADSSANRVAILNMAALQLTTNNPMRGARLIVSYLQAHPKPLDEPMLNTLGAMLMHAEERTRRQSLFQQAEQFYEEYNAKLETARPGMKRWGSQWLAADDVDQRMATWKRKQKEVARLSAQVAAINNRIASQQKELSRQQSLQARGWDNTLYIVQRELASLREELQNVQLRLDEAQPTEQERPPMPTEVAMVTLSQTTPPPVGEADQVAWGGQKHDGRTSAFTRRSAQPGTEQASANPAPGSDGKNPFQTLKAQEENATTPPEAEGAETEPAKPKKRIKVTHYAAAFPVGTDLLVTASSAVEGAERIQLQSSDGSSAEATVVRSQAGLSLLRVTGRKFTPLTLGGLFTGGPIQCAALTNVNIFQPAAKLVSGTASPAAQGWKIRLKEHPRLGGAPLLVDGKVIGVELAERDSETGEIPAATLDQLRALLGSDLPSAVGGTVDPTGLVVQVVATHEKWQ